MAGYAAWMLMLVAAYAAFPGMRTLAWALIGGSGVAAIVAGLALHRPARSEPWLLLAGACASLAASQVGFLITSGALRANVLFPWAGDGCALAACLLAAAGLAAFLRWRAAGRARQDVLDALLLAAGAAFACWLWLTLARGTGPVTVNRAFAAAFVLCDVLILAVACRGDGDSRQAQRTWRGGMRMVTPETKSENYREMFQIARNSACAGGQWP